MSDTSLANTSFSTTSLSRSSKTVVDIVPRIDISGRLFKLKDSNRKLKDTIVYNNFITRLNVAKDSIPGIPGMGLRNFLMDIRFTEDTELEEKITRLEEEIFIQMGKKCRVDYDIDKESSLVSLVFHLEDMLSSLMVTFGNRSGGNITVIETQILD